uniref:Uncharacterized protein n=1 Tax=Candidatus Kentrum sp. TC TaxID=2126339 RepID=A0A450YYR5_9GAMM|nr:MAG: hypothetical protein BECKTC1821E_GA0114239_102913 [Candidatus Kentron sp. TC]VFK46670.1 MAG: hypothetical protein BECKTC1821D_GA0114238_103410 [Candidatus Kentron sp. TC]
MKNPFSILDLDETATKKDIMAHVAKALQSGCYDAKTIASAQKTLFTHLTRARAEFRYCIDFGPYAVEAPEPLNEDCSIERLLL